MSSPVDQSGPPGTDNVICHAARFATQWVEPSLVVVSASGELDAANAPQLVDYALRHATRTVRVVLDLTEVGFFGIAGFTAAHALNAHCAEANIGWAMVPSPAVIRLLRVCDSDAALPVCADLPAALARLNGGPTALLKLVPEAS